MAQKRILVTGATGRQGGAVARHLLEAGFQVRILARDPSKPAAVALHEKGAEVIQGDLNQPPTLLPAVSGVHGVFSVQNYWEKGVGYAGEIRQGKSLADAAKKAGVAHYVQASVADADKAPGVRHFECKAEIVRHIHSLGLPYTVLGEVLYMENFLDPKGGSLMFPFLGGVLHEKTRMHLITVEDIGKIATVVFQGGDRYIGKTLDIAGDLLTLQEMKETYERVSGEKAKGWTFPGFFVRLMNGELYRQLLWNNSPGWRFDLSEARRLSPSMTTLDQFLRKHSVTNL